MPSDSVPVKILGFSLSITQPYSAGHLCTAAEAAALNKILTKGISKGLYKVLVAGLKPTGYSSAVGVPSELANDIQQRGEEYISDFMLGFATGHENVRAISVEISRIARQSLESELNAQGKRFGDLSAEELQERLFKLSQNPRVRNEAERRVRVTQEIASRAHEELMVGIEGEVE